MAYYASGSISAYKKLRKIVDGCFSDPTRRPFVSLMKTGCAVQNGFYQEV